jgi:glycosyltransferase involved in cell wall biosynthesis
VTDVLYDIAVLGLGLRDVRARTGVFRVVENVAVALRSEPSLELRFCATSGPAACLDYLRTHPPLASVPLAPSSIRTSLDRLFELTSASAPSGRTWKTPAALARRVVRRLALEALRRLPAVEPGELSRAQIFHSPYFPLPEVTRGLPRLNRFLTVYDLIPILRPELFELTGEHPVKQALASLTPDDWVVCISEATRQDLLSYRTDLNPDHVRVTHLGAARHFRPEPGEERWPELRRRYNLPEGPYLLTLSTLEPRKNIAQVIRCYARLVLEKQVGDLRLVLVGTRGWKMESIFAELDRLGHLRDRVIVTGYVPEEDLAPIYSRALMFLYPSLYEGFGLPPLEAMQCGTPVITSNTSSLPEVVGDAGLMVPPTDADALCQAVLSLYRDDELRRRLSARARVRASEFSWSRCGRETVAAYTSALAAR